MADSESSTRALTAAHNFFAALGNGEWDAAANMVDGDAAASFRESQLASLVAWAQHRPEMIERRARNESFGWNADGKLHLDLAAQVAVTPMPGVAGVQTLGQLVAMSPLDFVAACLQLCNALPEGPTERLPGGLHLVLGGVAEGNTIVHVLHRRAGPGHEYTDPHHVDVLRFVANEDVWRVDLTTFNHEIASASSLMMLADLSLFAPDGNTESGAADP